MRRTETSAFEIAQRYVGVSEIPGSEHNPAVLAMLKLDMDWPEGDEVPWCSGFVNWIAWHLRLPRSKSLRARSWLRVGEPLPDDAELLDKREAVGLAVPEPGFDVVVLMRGGNDQPGPDVIEAPGHVGLFAGFEGDTVAVLGGNQSDSVNIARYPRRRILGIRRLA